MVPGNERKVSKTRRELLLLAPSDVQRGRPHPGLICSPLCRCDKDIKVSYMVYNRLSVLLKSLLAITRVTPAYKLSRNQGHDYVILYR